MNADLAEFLIVAPFAVAGFAVTLYSFIRWMQAVAACSGAED